MIQCDYLGFTKKAHKNGNLLYRALAKNLKAGDTNDWNPLVNSTLVFPGVVWRSFSAIFPK